MKIVKRHFVVLSLFAVVCLFALLLAPAVTAVLPQEAFVEPWTWAGMGGGVRSLAWNGTNLYAGCNNGHVYRYDGGTTWTDTGSPDRSSCSVYSLAWNGTNLYAGGAYAHVYRYDGGTTWTDTGSPDPIFGGPVDSLVWTGTNLYASTGTNVCRYEGGTTWADTGILSIYTVENLAWNGTNLYAGCNNGHVYRYDGGTTWTDTWPTGGPSYIGCLGWNGTNLYAGCGTHVYRYDGGTTWTDTGSLGGVVSSLVWDGTNLYAGCCDAQVYSEGHVYRYDGGTTWTDTGSTGRSRVNSLVWNGTNLYAGSWDGFVYRYDGGTTWTDTGDKGGSYVESLAWNGTNLYAGGMNGHVYRHDDGTIWADTGRPGSSSYVAKLAWNGTNLYAGCNNGHVYRYDGGTTWTDTGSPGFSSCVNSLIWNGTNLYAGCDNGHVYRYDGGTTWTDTGSPGAGVRSMVWNGINLYAGCQYGPVYRYDGGTTWTDAGSPGPYTAENLAWNGTNVYAACSSHVYRYEGGTTWTDTGSPDPHGDHIESLVWNGTNLYVGCLNNQVFRYDGGTTWTDTDFTPKYCEIESLAWNGSNLYAGSDNGVFKLANPAVFSVVPDSGPPGTQVTVSGNGFGSSGERTGRKATATSCVSFNGVKVIDYIRWSDTEIICKVPDGATTGPVTVVVNGTESNNNKIFTLATPAWYLAEGTTAWGFSTYISIENPNSSEVTCSVTCMTPEGPKEMPDVTLPAQSQLTFNPQGDLGSTDFSTKVECTDPTKTIAVDRTLTWTGKDAKSPGGHSSVGVPCPAKTWYLAEGSCEWGFETWLLIQNPNSSEATCKVTYMTEGKDSKTVEHKVPANSRRTYNMREDLGFTADASIEVESNVSVIPERAMYRNNRREGSDSIGTTYPATDFYLAEGSTAWGFTTYVLVQNPHSTPTDVTITYMTPSGPLQQPTFTMQPNTRKTVRVNDINAAGSYPIDVSNTDLSTRVHGSQPIIAERAMYWGKNGPLGEACHGSIGVAMPHASFYLPDGETRNGFETWTLVQNPNGEEVEIEISYFTPSGQENQVLADKVPGNSRRTYSMANSIPAGRAAIMVKCKTEGKRIVVERAMYWNEMGAGTDTIGGYSD